MWNFSVFLIQSALVCCFGLQTIWLCLCGNTHTTEHSTVVNDVRYFFAYNDRFKMTTGKGTLFLSCQEMLFSYYYYTKANTSNMLPFKHQRAVMTFELSSWRVHSNEWKKRQGSTALCVQEKEKKRKYRN